MKRFRIFGTAKGICFLMILAGFAIFCQGQQRRQAGSRVSPLKIVQLPQPSATGSLSLEQVLARRRSVGGFTGKTLDFIQLGQLAWAGQRITVEQRGTGAVPSAGDVYPMTLYFVNQEGMFVYIAGEHSLRKLSDNDMRSRLATAAFGEKIVAEAACDIVIAGSMRRAAAKYSSRDTRYMLLQAGRVAQNIELQAVSLGLGAAAVAAFDTKALSRICGLEKDLEPLLMVCTGYVAGEAAAEPGRTRIVRPAEGPVEAEAAEVWGAESKRAVLIIASEKFRDEEFFDTRRELERANIQTVVASTKTGVIKGMLGSMVEATVLLSELRVDDYDAVVFIGGLGAREYFDDRVALEVARQSAAKAKVLGAICMAPAILANAGLLTGIRATSFSSERMRLKEAGAEYTGRDVERDGLIITGRGPRAALEFGRTVAEALRQGEAAAPKNSGR